MILGNPFRAHTSESPFRRMTLDDLFRRAVDRRGDAVALIDPPDRAAFTDGAPRRLTYQEADRVVSAIAARLIDQGLKTDAIVALQLPNTVDGVLALLGVLRAGMIAVPLPLLWRQAEAAQALSRIGARAFITCRRIGPVDHGELAMHIAAETFTIRFLCSFGADTLDGMVALDDVYEQDTTVAPPIERIGNPADHVAIVTFDTGADGLVPVARSHAELIAAGLTMALEGHIARDTALLGALAASSLTGLATMIVPWLLSGGTLLMHQPFDAAAFAAQCDDRCDVAVLPASLVPKLSEAGLVGTTGGPKTVLSVWRAPERLAGSAPWVARDAALVDVLAFGEIGLVAARRGADGKPGTVKPGAILAPRSESEGLVLLNIARNGAGTVTLGGAMVPHHPFPPGVRAQRRPAPARRRRRLGRYGLHLPYRPTKRRARRRRPARRHRQRRRLPLRAQGAAGAGRQCGRGQHTRRPARRALRTPPRRRRHRPQRGAPHARRPWRQPAARRRFSRAPHRPRLGSLTTAACAGRRSRWPRPSPMLSSGYDAHVGGMALTGGRRRLDQARAP